MPTDIEIAQNARLERIGHIAARAGIPDDALEPYGHYKAKVSLDWLDSQPERKDSRLVLVTAISPGRPARARPPSRSVWAMPSTASAERR